MSGGSMVTSMRTFTKFVGYYQVTPKLQTSLLQHRIVSVAAGYAFTVAVSSSGEVYGYVASVACSHSDMQQVYLGI